MNSDQNFSIDEERLSRFPKMEPTHKIDYSQNDNVRHHVVPSIKALSAPLHLLIGDDLWARIFEFVHVTDLLPNVTAVCQHFSALLQEDYFWQSYGKTVVKDLDIWEKYQTRYQWNLFQLQLLCAVATAGTKLDGVLPDFLTVESLLPKAFEARLLLKKQLRVCFASNTHHGTREAIENTLSPADIKHALNRRPAIGGWWSSEPSTSKDSTESLLYITQSPLSYLTKVKVKPLVDLFQGVLQVYSWCDTTISAYLVPASSFQDATGTNKAFPSVCSILVSKNSEPSDYDRMQDLLKNETPVYASPKFPTTHIVPRLGWGGDANQWVIHDLPTGIVANVVVITLHGKTARERLGYYACVDQVEVEGMALLMDREALLRSVCKRKCEAL